MVLKAQIRAMIEYSFCSAQGDPDGAQEHQEIKVVPLSHEGKYFARNQDQGEGVLPDRMCR